MLRNLSMIFLIKENSHMLDEVVHYHAPTNIHLYISHDSTQPYPIESFRNYPNVHYFHVNNTDTHLSMYDRVISLLPHISTDFCVFRADRRHQSNTILQKNLEFLQNNAEYSSASGVWINENLTIHYSLELITGNGEEEDPVTRTENLSLSFQSPFYNVQKTAFLKAFYEMIPHVQKKTSNIYYMKYLHAFLCYFTGKTKQFTHFGGIVQDKKEKHAYHATDWPEVGNLFVHQELKKYTLTIARAILKKHGFCTKNIEHAFELYSKALVLRFSLYGMSIYKSDHEKIKTFNYLEELFHMLNKKTPHDPKQVEQTLRVFMSKCFDFKCNIKHLLRTFDAKDTDEFENLLSLIKKIQAKQE